MIRDSLHGHVVEEVELADSRVRWVRLVLETVSQVSASWMEESKFMVEGMGTRGFGPRLHEVRST